MPKKEARKSRPAPTLEARENQMIALAVDLAEEQLRKKTASAQVITHYLKLGTSRERLEQEQLKKKNALLESQKEAVDSAGRVEQLYEKALKAMKSYAGGETEEDRAGD